MGNKSRIALITGANRGIGFEIARQLAGQGHTVLVAARSKKKGKAAVAQLRAEGGNAEFIKFDVTNPKEIRAAIKAVREDYGRIDILINNAGVFIESGDPAKPEKASVFNVTAEVVSRTIDINTLGPLRLVQAVVPLMRKAGYGRIVNMSSSMGQLNDMGGNWPGYRMSKAALNVLTRIVAAELGSGNIKINSVCPGWVRTDMGGPNARRSAEEGADTAVWLATLPEDGPTGGFFRDRSPLDW